MKRTGRSSISRLKSLSKHCDLEFQRKMLAAAIKNQYKEQWWEAQGDMRITAPPGKDER